MSNVPISRRGFLTQVAALPLLTSAAKAATVFAQPLAQLNVIVHGLAIMAVYTTNRPRIEIILPLVPAEQQIGAHVYLAGNFLGNNDDDCKDSSVLAPGEVYTLQGVVAGNTPPVFETDRNLIFSAPGCGLYIDPQQQAVTKVVLPFPSVSNSGGYSFRPAKRTKPNGSPDLPFCYGSAINRNQGSVTQLALTHILSYQISKLANVRLQSSSCDAPALNWTPQRKNTHPQSTTANLLIYAEPTTNVDGTHASHAFEHLTDLLPYQNSPGKLDLHFFDIGTQDIDPQQDGPLPDEVSDDPELLSLYARCTRAVRPANCVQVVVQA